MYMMRGEKIARQHDIRWGRRCWNRWKLFELYRNQDDPRGDSDLMEHCKRVAQAMNRFDSNTRYSNLQFATHEELQGLNVRHVDAWAEGTGGVWTT